MSQATRFYLEFCGFCIGAASPRGAGQARSLQLLLQLAQGSVLIACTTAWAMVLVITRR